MDARTTADSGFWPPRGRLRFIPYPWTCDMAADDKISFTNTKTCGHYLSIFAPTQNSWWDRTLMSCLQFADANVESSVRAFMWTHYWRTVLPFTCKKVQSHCWCLFDESQRCLDGIIAGAIRVCKNLYAIILICMCTSSSHKCRPFLPRYFLKSEYSWRKEAFLCYWAVTDINSK